MKEKILEDLKNAMKSQDKEALSTLRMLKGAIQLEEIDKKRDLADDEIIGVISKQIKTRKESVAQFEVANRTDLAEKTNSEINILSKYMPEELSKEELNKIIDEVFEKIKPTSMKDMKDIMVALNPLVKGRADMADVSKTIREKLG